jgi:ceroid-lipofuscinosis MFS transporter 7
LTVFLIVRFSLLLSGLVTRLTIMRYSKLSTEEDINAPTKLDEANDQAASVTSSLCSRRNSSLFIIGLITFVGDCSRGILFPVLWPVCQRLGGNTLDLSYLIALFSAGRLIISTPLGYLSDHYGHRSALIVSGVLFVSGSIMWAYSFHLVVLYVAQLLLGLGTGSLGVTRAYVAEQTSSAERTHVMSIFSALQYAGFAAMPLVGALAVIYGQDHANPQALELPAYCISVLSVVCLVLTIYPLQDLSTTEVLVEESYHQASTSVDCENPQLKPELQSFEIESDASPSSSAEQRSTEDETTLTSQPPSQDQLVFAWMIFLNFSTRGAVAVYETQLSRLFLDTYHLSELQLGLLVSTAGLLGTLQLLFYKQIWTQWQVFSDYSLMLLGLFVLVVAQAFVIIWYDTVDAAQPSSQQQNLWQVVVALYLVYGLGYPLANAAVLGCFSKLQRNRKQGFSQSLFALMGSLARVIVPIASGYAEAFVEPSSSFGMVGLLMLVSMMGLVLLEEPIIHSAGQSQSGQQEAVSVSSAFITVKTRRAGVLFFCVCSVGAVLKTLFD